MTQYLPPTDPAEDCAAETAAMIDHSHKMLAKFQSWAAAELRVMAVLIEQSRIATEEHRKLLMSAPGGSEEGHDQNT